jgi:hypothetical protein
VVVVSGGVELVDTGFGKALLVVFLDDFIPGTDVKKFKIILAEKIDVF